MYALLKLNVKDQHFYGPTIKTENNNTWEEMKREIFWRVWRRGNI
jgi:hypothetical protein